MALFATEAQLETLKKLSGLMALLEGHGDVTMERASRGGSVGSGAFWPGDPPSSAIGARLRQDSTAADGAGSQTKPVRSGASGLSRKWKPPAAQKCSTVCGQHRNTCLTSTRYATLSSG